MATSSKDSYKQRLKRSFDIAMPQWNRKIDNYKHYLGRLDVGNTKNSDYPFESQMTVPVSYEVVETVLPRYIGRDPEFTAVAIEPDDVPFEGTAKTAIETAYANPKLEMLGEPIYLKILRAAKAGLIEGDAVLRPFWRRETSKMVRYVASLKRAGYEDSEDIKKVLEAAYQLKASDEVTYSKKLVDNPFLDDFDVRHVPFFFYFGDFDMVETGRFRYHIEREYMTFDELADEATLFGYDKAMMDEVARECQQKNYAFTPEISKDFLNEYNTLFSSVNSRAFDTDNDKIPLLIVDKMWTGDRVHVFVNEKWQMTPEPGMPSPYDVRKPPFVFMHDVPMPHSYFSRGEIDAIKKLEDGMTDTLNMRFDNLIQSMLNIWLYDTNLMAEGEEFVPVPNSVYGVKDTERAVRSISMKDVTPYAYKEADSLYQIIQRVTGVNDYVKGSEGETLAGRTYGGLRLVQEAANARFIIKSRLFEKLTLKSLGYFMLEFSRQFINKDRVSRMVGSMDEVVERNVKAGELKQIKGFFDIRVLPNSSAVIDQQAEALKLQGVADRFITGKGPFANIPEEVFDKFLLKYLQVNGVHDAIYWVKSRRDARLKAEAAAKKPTVPAAAEKPEVPAGPALPAGMPTMQSDQIAPQPNPLAQILNAGAPPPPPGVMPS